MEVLTPEDLTDDRLADMLRLLSDDERFRAFEHELMGQLLRVYEWKACCVRIDTTSASTYAQINEEWLLQLGHSNGHRPDLPQLKLALVSEVLSGEQADDPVYVPLIERVHTGLQQQGLLYVGDCKMADLQIRASIAAHSRTLVGNLSRNHFDDRCGSWFRTTACHAPFHLFNSKL